MSPDAPEATRKPGPLDFDAAAELEDAENASLITARALAKNWVGGLTALTSTVALVVILKGPDSTSDLSNQQRVYVLIMVAGAFLSLSISVLTAYLAAYGGPNESKIRRTVLAGLHHRLAKQRRAAAKSARDQLRAAIALSVLGSALLVAANAVTWFPPAGKSSPSNTCVEVDGESVLRIASKSISVVETKSGVAVVPCE